MILDIMEEKLTPVFEHIGGMFDEYKARIEELENVIGALVSSMSDAVDGHRRTGITSIVKEKYGADLDSLGPVYSDFSGEDLTEKLIDAVMQDGGDVDEAAGKFLGPIKEKFGKYSMREEKRAEPPAQGELELSVETKPEEKSSTEQPQSEETPESPVEEKPRKASDALFETMGIRARKTA